MVEQRADPPDTPFSELVSLAPLNPRQARDPTPWPALMRERLLGSLPAVLMGVLAALTWWLVKNSPVAEAPASAPVVRSEPDYTMRGFLVQRFGPDGVMRAQVEGDVMRHFPDTDNVEIEGVRMRAIEAETGRVLRGDARRARSNGQGTRIELIDNARVVREALAGEPATERMEMTGEYFEILPDEERVRTHQAVTLRRAGGTEIVGGSLDYDRRAGLALFGGGVRGVLKPTPAP
jgi:lipopolysaccharide export system protein LptC